MATNPSFGDRLRKLVDARSSERAAHAEAAADTAAYNAQRRAEAARQAQLEHARQLRMLDAAGAASRLHEFGSAVLGNLGRAHRRRLAGQYALLRFDHTFPYWHRDETEGYEYTAPPRWEAQRVNGYYLCRKQDMWREDGIKQTFQRYGGIFVGFASDLYGVGWTEWAPGATELEFWRYLLSNDGMSAYITLAHEHGYKPGSIWGSSHPDGKWMDRQQMNAPEAELSQQARQFTEQELTWLAARLLSDKVSPGIYP